MSFPASRYRRLRQSASMRALVRETSLSRSQLIMPLFIVPGSKIKTPIRSLPGINYLSADSAVEEVRELGQLGINAVILFGVPDSKDETGSGALNPKEIIPTTLEKLRQSCPETLLIADLCFCEYTSHGHCGVLDKRGNLDNDRTLELLAQQALVLANAGAHILAPSGMIDGMVGAIRHALDQNTFLETAIMSYAAKYASAFYGPFRDAVNSSPQNGDRRSYQMDSANRRQAHLEVQADIDEGADIVMVKPALAFLDVVADVRRMTDLPVAAYNVSGEYSMVKAAAAQGLINEDAIMREMLLSIKRAGADIIISYFAKQFATQVET